MTQRPLPLDVQRFRDPWPTVRRRAAIRADSDAERSIVDDTLQPSEIMSDPQHSGEPSQLALDAIADAEPYPYWLESAEIPESNPTLVRDEHCDLCIVGGGYTGLWTAVIAKERDPSRDIVLIDKGEVGGAASGRNGGFMEASLTHGVGNGMDRHADEIDVLEELGVSNLDEIEAAIERYAHGLRVRTQRCDRRGPHEPSAVVSRRAARGTRPAAFDRPTRDVARPGCDARGGRLAHLHGRALPFGSGGAGRPGEVGLGTQAGRRRTRRADLRALQGHRHRQRRHRRRGAHPARHGPLRQGRARHQRRQTAAQAHRPVHDPRVRLLPGDRAAEHRAARPHRMEASPGPVRHHQPVPLLPTHGRQPHPVGRLRRHLLLGIEGRQRTREPTRDLGEVVRPLLRDLPAARRRALLPRLGWGDRHEHEVLGVLRPGDVEPRRLRSRLHRPRRRRDTVRGIHDARPARRPQDQSPPRPTS